MSGAVDFETDVVVIGAGVVGLATAASMARAGREVLVLEAGDCIGGGISSRNSEVIHAGIYYATGSLKAQLCLRGREMLYSYCAQHGVPHRRITKLIVASHENELPSLAEIAAKARDNGVDDMVTLDRAGTIRLEPALDAVASLLSPSTGIVDSHALMLTLQAEAESHGALLALRAPVEGGSLLSDGVHLRVGGGQPATICARMVVNAAGLHAHRVAASLDGVAAGSVPTVRYAKGSYFSLVGRAPFSRLIYPMPEPGGFGVHLTLDLAGMARFGPDVEWIDDIDFRVDPHRSARFYGAIRRYWPGLKDDALHPAYAGVRPKIGGAASPDFIIDRPCSSLVNLFGIESPGLTSSLAIAQEVEILCNDH